MSIRCAASGMQNQTSLLAAEVMRSRYKYTMTEIKGDAPPTMRSPHTVGAQPVNERVTEARETNDNRRILNTDCDGRQQCYRL
jgi:hypothetical protein